LYGINVIYSQTNKNIMKITKTKTKETMKTFLLRAPESLLTELAEVASNKDHSINSFLNSEIKKIISKNKN